MLTPKKLVDALEHKAELPEGSEERFSGYGVMAVPFISRHILCLRRWPASSVGQGYTSVWHRHPDGEWIFIQDVPPREGCARYFGSAIAKFLRGKIEIEWSSPWKFRVTTDGDYHINWQVSLDQNLVTRTANTLGNAVPDPLWQKEWFLKFVGHVGSLAQGKERMNLTGQVPNGQKVRIHPKSMFIVSSSSATVNGQDLGEMGPLPTQARLGDIWLPQSGRFFIARAFMEPFDPDRHLATTSQEAET